MSFISVTDTANNVQLVNVNSVQRIIDLKVGSGNCSIVFSENGGRELLVLESFSKVSKMVTGRSRHIKDLSNSTNPLEHG